jgi:SAM-dependent methyltransferase
MGSDHTTCIACGGDAPEQPLYEKWGCEIRRCPSCGLGRTVVPDGFDPASIYDQTYYQGGQRDGYADYAGSEPLLRREFRRVLRHLRRHGATGGRLLEIGCAYGFFLMEAQEHFTCTGIEISGAAVAKCQSSGLAVQREPLDGAFVRGRGPFDVAVMLEVFPLLPDPAGTLQQVRDVLVDGGLALITTGDFGSPLARLMGRSWRLMTPPQQLYFFTRAAMRSLLDRCGFEVIAFDRPWKRVPLGLAAYQVGRRTGLRVPALESIGLGVPVNLFDTMRVIARKRG